MYWLNWLCSSKFSTPPSHFGTVNEIVHFSFPIYHMNCFPRPFIIAEKIQVAICGLIIFEVRRFLKDRRIELISCYFNGIMSVSFTFFTSVTQGRSSLPLTELKCDRDGNAFPEARISCFIILIICAFK
jgi:DUF917 family protein